MQVGTRSVLNPILWLSAIVFPVGIAGALLADGAMTPVLAFVAILPPLVAVGSYVYFMLKDPDRLQSEPFRIEQQWAQSRIVDNRTNEELPIYGSAVGPNAPALITGSEQISGQTIV